ncbi:MAG: Pseudogene of DEAD/DEAH box helicase [Methanobrevibacter sp. CfCl-M3]
MNLTIDTRENKENLTTIENVADLLFKDIHISISKLEVGDWLFVSDEEDPLVHVELKIKNDLFGSFDTGRIHKQLAALSQSDAKYKVLGLVGVNNALIDNTGYHRNVIRGLKASTMAKGIFVIDAEDIEELAYICSKMAMKAALNEDLVMPQVKLDDNSIISFLANISGFGVRSARRLVEGCNINTMTDLLELEPSRLKTDGKLNKTQIKNLLEII